jgi:cell division transport system ATP-binding protein
VGLNRSCRAIQAKRVADFRVHVQEPDSVLTHTSELAGSQTAVLRVEGLVIPPCPAPIEVSVARGEAVALVDPGKSVGPRFLDLIAFARPPREGRIELFGADLRRVPPDQRPKLRRRLGLILRDLQLAEDLDAFDNLALAARAVGRSAGDYAAPARELLAWVGLAGRDGQAAAEMDEEARRRLALARALVNGPDILIADEPAGGLQDAPRRAVLKLIADLHAAGTAVLLFTGDEALARSGAQVVRLGTAEDGLAGAA